MKTNIKMRVTPEQSKRVQEICFKNGIEWRFNLNKISHINEPYLAIEPTALFYRRTENDYFSIPSLYKEIDADLFIRTNGTCEENSNYKSGDFLKCIVFYDIEVRVGATYQIQKVDNYNSRITFLGDDLDTRSIEISRLNKYFKKVENKYTELSTSIDKPYNVTILESKLKKKNDILKKARIKRKNQREELNKLNLKLQKCISLVEHRKVLDWHIERNESLFAEIDNLKAENIEMGKLVNLNKSALDLAVMTKDLAMNEIERKNNEIEKLKAVIEYLESKVK